MATRSERDELHKTIWAIANKLRGKVDGWDFKAYVLGTIFYRYISENLTNYINKMQKDAGEDDFDYTTFPDEYAEEAKEQLVAEKGFFILPSQLFCNVAAKAEMDEFKILKAQMDKHLGIQPRWSKKKLQDLRKRSDIDPNKYSQLVVDDETAAEHEYQSAYRGKVQNRKVTIDFLPERPITGFDPKNGQSMLQNYADAMANASSIKAAITPTIAEVTAEIENTPDESTLYYTRGTILAKQGDYVDAIKDLTTAIGLDPRMPEAYFNRGLCHIFSDNKKKGLDDLSKAGELGLYSAYSVIKKFNNDKK